MAYDLASLLSDLEPSADARSESMRRLGTLFQFSGDKVLAPVGQGMIEEESRRRQQHANAATTALHYGPQLAERDELIKARQDPRYGGALRQVLGNYGVETEEGTPPLVLEKMLGPAEKFAQAQIGAGLRNAFQNRLRPWTDPNTSEPMLIRPLDGATFHMDGSPRTKGIAPAPQAPGRVPAPASPAPAAAAPPPGQEPAPEPGAAPAPKPRMLVAPKPAPSGPLMKPGSGKFPPMMGRILDKAIQAFGTDLDTNKGTGEVQKNQARLNAAIRLRALVTNEDGSVKDKIPPQFMKETAMALAQLVSAGGQPAQTLIEELTPHTKSSKVADIVQWITDNPQDAGQQAFVKLYLESANREAVKAQEALNKAISSRVGKHQRLIRGNPEEAKVAAQGFGWNLDPETMTLTPIQSADVASGAAEPAAKAPAASPDDLAAKEWAAKNPNDPRAAKILERLKAKGL